MTANEEAMNDILGSLGFTLTEDQIKSVVEGYHKHLDYMTSYSTEETITSSLRNKLTPYLNLLGVIDDVKPQAGNGLQFYFNRAVRDAKDGFGEIMHVIVQYEKNGSIHKQQ